MSQSSTSTNNTAYLASFALEIFEDETEVSYREDDEEYLREIPRLDHLASYDLVEDEAEYEELMESWMNEQIQGNKRAELALLQKKSTATSSSSDEQDSSLEEDKENMPNIQESVSRYTPQASNSTKRSAIDTLQGRMTKLARKSTL